MAHQTGSSGHNPDRTGRAEYKDGDRYDEVRAIDVDVDFKEPSVTPLMVVNHIIRLPSVSKVLRYVIYDRKIYSASNGWRPAKYTGSNPHDHHIHFSGAYSQAADENTTFDYRLNELGDAADDMATISQNDFNARMDAWFNARMAPSAKDNPARKYLRVAAWQQEVGRSGISTHDTLFFHMRNEIKALRGAVEVLAGAVASGTGVSPEALKAAVAAAISQAAPSIADAVADEASGRLEA
ncbi:hypothetical protein AB0M54_45965 [Actinoplanes sp. NPDC051470]|uniref:hypothetical protein n=1 Tax=Actinoplanes sp. NPDC051470 TaxID=3157224 RepID=UPI0034143757